MLSRASAIPSVVVRRAAVVAAAKAMLAPKAMVALERRRAPARC